MTDFSATTKKQAFSQGQLLFDSIIDMCGRVGRQKIEW
jgi:hypothetical protein